MTEILSQLDERALLLEPRERLDKALVGVATNEKGGKVAVYDYDLLVIAFSEDMDGDTPEEREAAAAEWVAYNTFRSLPYAGEWAPEIHGTLGPRDDEDDEP